MNSVIFANVAINMEWRKSQAKDSITITPYFLFGII